MHTIHSFEITQILFIFQASCAVHVYSLNYSLSSSYNKMNFDENRTAYIVLPIAHFLCSPKHISCARHSTFCTDRLSWLRFLIQFNIFRENEPTFIFFHRHFFQNKKTWIEKMNCVENPNNSSLCAIVCERHYS